jgi:hypothetical protein
MSLSTWLSDATANRYRKTYFNGFVDIKDGDIIIRNGSIKTPMNTITFNDTTINYGFCKYFNALSFFNVFCIIKAYPHLEKVEPNILYNFFEKL